MTKRALITSSRLIVPKDTVVEVLDEGDGRVVVGFYEDTKCIVDGKVTTRPRQRMVSIPEPTWAKNSKATTKAVTNKEEDRSEQPEPAASAGRQDSLHDAGEQRAERRGEGRRRDG